jgi:hypothetical protein
MWFLGRGGGWRAVSPVAPELIFENEPILANEAIFANGPGDSGDFGGLRIRGIFVFADDKVSFMFQFREE